MLKVSRRGGFSDRFGIKPENTNKQVKQFDKRTRVQINNIVNKLCSVTYKNKYIKDEDISGFLTYVMGEVYSEPVDSFASYHLDVVLAEIKNTILEDDYDSVLTMVESIAQYWHKKLLDRDHSYYNDFNNDQKSVFGLFNSVFEKEYVGFRFVGGEISPITDLNEINAVNEAISIEDDPVSNHISKALKLLSDREKPDYENSIKESISAVEAMCCIITDSKGEYSSLGKTLKRLEDNGIIIHSSLREAFKKLYGYTSDANGIRHAGNIDGPNATFEEAKYMLVSCSAFINYLKAVISD